MGNLLSPYHSIGGPCILKAVRILPAVFLSALAACAPSMGRVCSDISRLTGMTKPRPRVEPLRLGKIEGIFFPGGDAVYIDPELSREKMERVLVHETAHYYMDGLNESELRELNARLVELLLAPRRAERIRIPPKP